MKTRDYIDPISGPLPDYPEPKSMVKKWICVTWSYGTYGSAYEFKPKTMLRGFELALYLADTGATPEASQLLQPIEFVSVEAVDLSGDHQFRKPLWLGVGQTLSVCVGIRVVYADGTPGPWRSGDPHPLTT